MGSKRARNERTVTNLQFEDSTFNQRNMDAGFAVRSLGAVPATEIEVGKRMPVRITNGSGGTIYVNWRYWNGCSYGDDKWNCDP